MSELTKTSRREKINARTAKIGGYSVVMSLVVLAILIAINIFMESLPTTMTQYDISAARLYTLTSSTKAVVTNLDKDVTIYWVVQSGEEDDVLERLLNVYANLSDRLSVIKMNPDVYPTFAKQYTDETVYNNSIIVKCGDRYRYISYYDIYEYDTTYYYYTGSIYTDFDGEGEITSAIDYVASDNLPVLYFLTGHGEEDLSETITDAIDRANMETESLTLLTVDEIPEDASCIIINAPDSDLSEEEITMLQDYIADGGRVLVLSGPQESVTLTNLQTLLSYYGVTVNEGIVVEGDRNYYAFGYPYILLPEIQSSDITDELIDDGSYLLMGLAGGLSVGSTSNGTVTELLTTSESAFSKVAGFALTTVEKEDGDIDGPFTLGVSIEDGAGEGKLIWFSTDYLLGDTYVSYSSGANTELFISAVSDLVGEEQTLSIPTKSMDANYLTISDSDITKIKICLLGIIPIAYLLYGVEEVWRRRKKA